MPQPDGAAGQPSAARITLASMPCSSEACTMCAMDEAAEVIGLPSPE
ncbi:hypothetical protein ACFQQB_61740 [Nonomuraea rubra]